MSEKVKPHPGLGEFLEKMEELNPDALGVSGLEAAIVGYIERIGAEPLVVFDRGKCMEVLMIDEDLSQEDAMEHFEYNIIGAWMGEGTPVFLTTIDDA